MKGGDGREIQEETKKKELTKGTIGILRHQVRGKVRSSVYNGEGNMQKSIEVTFTGALFDRDPTFWQDSEAIRNLHREAHDGSTTQ